MKTRIYQVLNMLGPIGPPCRAQRDPLGGWGIPQGESIWLNLGDLAPYWTLCWPWGMIPLREIWESSMGKLLGTLGISQLGSSGNPHWEFFSPHPTFGFSNVVDLGTAKL